MKTTAAAALPHFVVQEVKDPRSVLVRVAALKKLYPTMYLNMFNDNSATGRQVVYHGRPAVGRDDDMQMEICGHGVVDHVLIQEFLGLRYSPGGGVCFVALPEIPFRLDEENRTVTMDIPGQNKQGRVLSVGLTVSVSAAKLQKCTFYVVCPEKKCWTIAFEVDRRVNCSLRALNAISNAVL